jgi:hypothetical protein
MVTYLQLGITDGISVSLVSINVWRLAGDTLNITCNFLYCYHQVHRYFWSPCICKAASSSARRAFPRLSISPNAHYHLRDSPTPIHIPSQMNPIHVVCWNYVFNPLTPKLNPSAQRCLPRFFTGILIFKVLTARRLYIPFGVKGLSRHVCGYKRKTSKCPLLINYNHRFKTFFFLRIFFRLCAPSLLPFSGHVSPIPHT